MLLPIVAGGILVLVVLSFVRFRRHKGKPLPPGPNFSFSHLRTITAANPEFEYIKWGKEYNSDILYLNVLGRDIIVLNSVQAANDLLDKRGANYVDRPRFALFEVMGWGITLTFLR